MNNPFEKISKANDSVSDVISLAASKKEFVLKQFINVVLLFIILLVFGCLDFAKLAFHFENLLSASYWGTVISKTIAGICAYNIGINLLWEIEIKKDKILDKAIKLYNHLIDFKDDKDFDYFVTNVFNPTEKKKAYVSQINRKIYFLNRFSRGSDKLLYSSEIPQGTEDYDKKVEELKNKKLNNRYCIKRQELEDLKSDEYIAKNLDSINVSYQVVDPVVFSLEIDGSAIIRGVKTKGSVSTGKVRASSSVALGMIAFSMFVTAIALELNQEQFANQMVRFWHYLMKCVTDVGIVAWQTYRGMLGCRKIISSELTQPYVGRNKVLIAYYDWKLEKGYITSEEHNEIVNFKDEIEITMTKKELNELTKGE